MHRWRLEKCSGRSWRFVLCGSADKKIYPSAPPTEQQPRVIRVAVNVEMGELSSDVPFALLSGFEVVGYEVVATFDILARLVPGKLTPGMLATGLGSDSWVFASK